MLFNKKLTATLLAALILTSATNADAMGFNWRKWALFGAIAAVATLVITKMWAAPHRPAVQIAPAPEVVPAPQIIPAVQMPAPQPVPTVNNQANTLGQELIHALAWDNADRVRDLIAAGANLEARDRHGNTPLMLTAGYNLTDIAQTLITAGASLEARNRYGDTALISAAQCGKTDIIRALIAAHANLDTRNNRGETALTWAASHGHTQIAQALIDAGANLEIGNITALRHAVQHGRTDIVRALIDAGAHVNAEDKYGHTALTWAAHLGRTQIAQALIAAGANLDKQNNHGQTALTWAASGKYTEIAQTLIAAGADINAQDNTGFTALIIAAISGNTEIAQALIAAGANLEIQNQGGFTAIMLARQHIVDLITQEQNRTSTPLHHACSHGIGSENIELILRDESKRRAIETMYPDINNLPEGTMTDDIQGEIAQLVTQNTNGYTARQYLQTRAWMMQPITITIRTLTGDTLTLNCTRGTQIHALKRLIAQQLSTPEHTVNTSMIRLTRKNNNAEATDYEVAGITNEFYVIIGNTQQHNPGRAQAGPANA